MFSASHLLLSIHTDLLGGGPQCVLFVSFVTEHSYRHLAAIRSVFSSSHLLLSIHTDLLGGGPQCVLGVSFVTEHSYRLTWRRSAVCSLRLICY